MQTNGHCVAEDNDQVYNCDEVDQRIEEQQQVCYEEQVHMQNGVEQIETEQQVQGPQLISVLFQNDT